jgi:uncharacterized protein YcfJ
MNNNNSNNTRNPNRPRNNNTANPSRNTRRPQNDHDQDERPTNPRQRSNSDDRQTNYAANERDDYPQRAPRRSAAPRNRSREEYDNRPPQRDYYDDDYAPQQAKSNKTLLISLAAVAAIAIATGIAFMLTKSSTAQIISVNPNFITTQQAYQDCRKVGTTSYVANRKNGTEGALIGGATGAVAGGVIGNQVHGGGGGTAVGAIAGGVGGALIGREIQRSNQPNYVAKHGSSTQCATAYKPVQTQVGYSVQYMYKNEMANIVTQTAPAIGSTLPLEQLQAMAVPAAQLNQSNTQTN